MIIGKKILHYPVIDSTNSEARRLIKKGEGEGVVVVADRQTRGRGRIGRGWFSPKGNLYLSAVVRPYKNPQDLVPITLLGALAARAVISKVAKLPVVIKWPNDLYVGGKKVGGILTERLPSGYLIVGVGINLNVVPAAVRRTATALRISTGKRVDPRKVSAALMRELDREYLAYLSKVC